MENRFKIVPRRKGTLTEYQNGHYFMYVTEWGAEEDGAGRKHVEIEIFYSKAQLIWNSTDPAKLEKVKEIFQEDPSAFKHPAKEGTLPIVEGVSYE